MRKKLLLRKRYKRKTSLEIITKNEFVRKKN